MLDVSAIARDHPVLMASGLPLAPVALRGRSASLIVCLQGHGLQAGASVLFTILQDARFSRGVHAGAAGGTALWITRTRLSRGA